MCGNLNNEANRGSWLPEEVLVLVFRQLDRSSLQQVVLVCRAWRRAGEDPALWAGAGLTITPTSLSHQLASRRVARAVRITLAGGYYGWREPRLVEQLLEQAGKMGGLCWLEGLDQLQLAGADPILLQQLLNRLERVELRVRGRDSQEDIGAVLAAVQPGTALASLACSHNCLTALNPELLADLTRVTTVDLTGTQLTAAQLSALLGRVAGGAAALTSLSLAECDLAGVEAELLGRAAACLVRLDICGGFCPHTAACIALSPRQAAQLFTEIADPASRLEVLDIGEKDLSRVEPVVLAAGVAGLQVAYLMKTKLTATQLTAILARALEFPHLRALNCTYNPDCGAMDIDLVRRARKNGINLIMPK